jgi:uncharacterized protein (AIM24 family)
MADFQVHELEGTRFVEIHLNHEMVRVEAGALSYLKGDISIHSPLVPSVGGMIKSALASQAIYRPIYSGSGVITLESSLGGFHILDLNGESWILERGAYWASEGSIEVKYHRERLQTAIWSGEGPLYLQTRVTGHGTMALATRGPVEEHTLEEGERVVAEGKYVICRTGEVKFTVRRPTKNFFGRFTSGEGLARVYEGPGRILLNPAPYWRYRMFNERGRNPEDPSRTTC